MGWKSHGKDSNAWASKCAGPRKVRWPTQSAQAVIWVRGTPSARTRAKCVGGSPISRAALSARAAILWRGEWAALPTHLPRTCHAMPTHCNCGSTRVGRDEPQSPGTLRVNYALKLNIFNMWLNVRTPYTSWRLTETGLCYACHRTFLYIVLFILIIRRY